MRTTSEREVLREVELDGRARVVEVARLGLAHVSAVLVDGVRGDEARVTFRDTAVPRMKGLSAAFHEVQFQAEVRRTHPLSLKLTRVGGSPILEGLVRALKGLAAA